MLRFLGCRGDSYLFETKYFWHSFSIAAKEELHPAIHDISGTDNHIMFWMHSLHKHNKQVVNATDIFSIYYNPNIKWKSKELSAKDETAKIFLRAIPPEVVVKQMLISKEWMREIFNTL